MPRAVELRLRAALEEYRNVYRGDNPRNNVRGTNANLVKQAEELLKGLGPDERSGADSPGRRAAAAHTPASQSIHAGASRLRDSVGASREAAQRETSE